ncbi:translation elongation factor 4 [bacterium]|nr:translation elongation factor 4 [bacterium]MBU1152654.1 translation elongation factor 4 [bacterium]
MKLTSKIRNFAIVAHIDHGKSTLADRLIEDTNTLGKQKVEKDQILDNMDLERERGITIKAHPIRLSYQVEAGQGETYILNLIDTPGHVDFTYEVSRSLVATEGIILLIDASQGVEAQTLAHANLAKSLFKKIIPCINKIDLPNANLDSTLHQIEKALNLDPDETILVSAKEGIGIKDLLEAIIKKIPPPQGNKNEPLQALVFDSWFDPYKGVIIYLRVVNGLIKTGDQIILMSNHKSYIVTEVGVLTLGLHPKEKLEAGEVGYIFAGIKDIEDVNMGETITLKSNPALQSLPGYKKEKPMVFCSFYPINSSDYSKLGEAFKKLRLNDASFTYEGESSNALGFGFKCGFLGVLHKEIIQERIEREYNIESILTSPNVLYQITKKDHSVIEVSNPALFPNPGEVLKMEEPYILATIITPSDHIGPLIDLLNSRRGKQKSFVSLDDKRVILAYELPLAEVIIDFYDKLKSLSHGYASFDYEHIGYRESKLVKLEILILGEVIDALSLVVFHEKAQTTGRSIVERLRGIIPRQNFVLPIQAAIGSKIIARETIPAFRKDVIAKCYGGDITRKRKLLEKQKLGKKRLKQVGKVAIPQEAFQAILKI